MVLPEKYILNLPEPKIKPPETPKYTATEMAQMCEKYLPLWNAKRFAEKPIKRKVEPFKLK